MTDGTTPLSGSAAIGGKKRACVYILRCSDGTLYTGWTPDIERRVRLHNAGKASKYTRSRLPVVLVYLEECAERGAALSRECAIKKLTRAKKLRLIEEYGTHLNNL